MWYNEWWGIVLVFFLMAFLLHVFFVWLFPLGEVAWKRADYAWIALTILSLGVYGGMNENFVLVAGRSRWQADGV